MNKPRMTIIIIIYIITINIIFSLFVFFIFIIFSPTSTNPVGLKIEIKLNVIWSGSHGSEKLLSFGNVFRNARILPLCTAMEIR